MIRTARLIHQQVVSSAWATPQSKAIHRAIVKDLKEAIGNLITGISSSRGHFYTNIFIKTKSGNCWNIFTSDYRWFKNITVRTCHDFQDYTGGPNISLGKINKDTANEVREIILKGESQ